MSRAIVEVYAHWQPIEAPQLIGLLTYSDSSRGDDLQAIAQRLGISHARIGV